MSAAFGEFENRLRLVISGLFGSIAASFSVALGVSVLTESRWTIVTSGIIVGIAGSLANAASPFVTRTHFLKAQISLGQVFRRSVSSFILTFIIIFLPIVSYLMIDNLGVAQITSLATGLVMLFIFGVHRAKVEGRANSVINGFSAIVFGAFVAFLAYAVAKYYILQ